MDNAACLSCAFTAAVVAAYPQARARNSLTAFLRERLATGPRAVVMVIRRGKGHTSRPLRISGFVERGEERIQLNLLTTSNGSAPSLIVIIRGRWPASAN